jgi:hypothetical protein
VYVMLLNIETCTHAQSDEMILRVNKVVEIITKYFFSKEFSRDN